MRNATCAASKTSKAPTRVALLCILILWLLRLPPNVDKLATSIATHRERIVTHLEEAQRLAKLNIERTQQTMKAHYDQQAKPTKYKVGKKVWIYTPKTKKGLSKKLLYKWHRPFRIVKQLSPVNFQLRTQANRLLSAPVHVNRMKLYFDPLRYINAWLSFCQYTKIG